MFWLLPGEFGSGFGAPRAQGLALCSPDLLVSFGSNPFRSQNTIFPPGVSQPLLVLVRSLVLLVCPGMFLALCGVCV